MRGSYGVGKGALKHLRALVVHFDQNWCTRFGFLYVIVLGFVVSFLSLEFSGLSARLFPKQSLR